MRFGQGVGIRASGGRCSKESRRKMAKSQRVYGQCSLAQAALSVWSRLGWNWQAGHALAVVEDSSTVPWRSGGRRRWWQWWMRVGVAVVSLSLS